MTRLPNGRIIRACIRGQGKREDWKIRPAVVMGYSETRGYLVLVGTHSLKPDDPDRVPIASGRSGERVTGLSQRTEINCGWRAWVDPEDIAEEKGHLPPREFDQVARRERDIAGQGR